MKTYYNAYEVNARTIITFKISVLVFYGVFVANRCAELTVDDRNMTVRKTYGGALLTFTCFPGWSVRGHHSIYCDGEKWSGFPPTCICKFFVNS